MIRAILEQVYEAEGSAPDVLDVTDDPAVRQVTPPEKVWVDLAGLWPDRSRPRAGAERPAGIGVTGLVRGMLHARVLGRRGWWIGVVALELNRDDAPVLTGAALVPSWALRRRQPGDRRRLDGKTSNRASLAQRAVTARRHSPPRPDAPCPAA